MSSHSLLNGRGLNDKDCREPVVTAAGLKFWYNSSGKPYIVHSSTTPTASASGFAIGCEWLNTATGLKYVNSGTATAATWDTVITNGSAAQDFAGNVTVSGTLTVDGASTLTGATTQTGLLTVAAGITGSAALPMIVKTNTATALTIKDDAGSPNTILTVDTTTGTLLNTIGQNTIMTTSKSFDTTSADTLKQAGVIVPTVEPVRFTIFPHATQTTYTLLNNRSVGWTVVGITCVPDLAQGGALTATIVKATVNAAPASGTTPMHTANAIDCNATANTSQVITLTATGADLVLAATDKIGIVFNAALTTGILSGTIWVKRS